jgi:hypothetical protein
MRCMLLRCITKMIRVTSWWATVVTMLLPRSRNSIGCVKHHRKYYVLSINRLALMKIFVV